MRTSATMQSQLIDSLSREDGWKPTPKAMKRLRPKVKGKRNLSFENAQAVKVQAERMVAESEANDGLRLVGEEQ